MKKSKLIKKPVPAPTPGRTLELKKLSEDQLKNVMGGIGWPSHAAAN